MARETYDESILNPPEHADLSSLPVLLALAQIFGIAVALLNGNTAYKKQCYSDVCDRLIAGITQKQYKILFNEYRSPIAFISWATLTRRVEDVMRQDGTTNLDTTEWTEGDRVWIVDFAVRAEHFRHVYRYLRKTLLPRFDSVSWRRVDTNRRSVRMKNWRSKRGSAVKTETRHHAAELELRA
jgi:hemolysin-activating ACP:hemolysin acyltransferase